MRCGRYYHRCYQRHIYRCMTVSRAVRPLLLPLHHRYIYRYVTVSFAVRPRFHQCQLDVLREVGIGPPQVGC